MNNNGTAVEYIFSPKITNSLLFRVDEVSSGTYNVGLAEIKVLGRPAVAAETVTTPTTPSGPASGTTGSSLSYTTGGSS